jgi:hypothetical protein
MLNVAKMPIMVSVIMSSEIMLCRYTECHMLGFVMLSVVRANFVAPLQPTLIFQLKLLHSKGACKALHSCPNHKR